MSNKLKKIIIATGGTGGHVFPAYSLAKHFIDSKKINVEIISDKLGLRYLQNYHDVKIIEINSSTIFKKNICQLLFSILIILYSIFRSLIFLLMIQNISHSQMTIIMILKHGHSTSVFTYLLTLPWAETGPELQIIQLYFRKI